MVRVALALLACCALALAVVLCACGPSASNVPILREAGDHCQVGGCVDGGFETDDSSVPITWDPLEDWDGGDGGPLTGIFAVEATVTARAGIEVTSKQLYRLRIFQDGTSVHQKTTLCLLTLPSVPNVVTLDIPAALQELIEATSSETTGNYLSNPAILEAAYIPPPFLDVLGAADLTNPATDPLPTMDSGIATDDDNDGHPGVTLIAQTVTCTSAEQLYVALRVSGELAGTVQTLDVITGLAQIHLDESVVGYSDPCLAVASTITITVEPNSPYRAQRVGAAQDINGDGNVSCPEIIDQASSIFPDWASSN
jgi:hypothetical protein